MGRYTLEKIQEKELFYQMPKWIYEFDLKPLDREIYMLCYENYKLSLMNNWINKKGEIYFFNSQETLMEKLKVAKNTIIKSFDKLIQLGLIETEKENGKANKYFLIDKNTSAKTEPVQKLNQFKNSTAPVQILNPTSVKTELVPVQKLNPNKNLIRTINKNELNKNELIGKNKKTISLEEFKTEINKQNISDFLKEKLLEWVEFKNSIGDKYKSFLPITKVINQIGKDFKDEKHLADSIDFSIMQNYKGIHPKKNYNFNNFKNVVEAESAEPYFNLK